MHISWDILYAWFCLVAEICGSFGVKCEATYQSKWFESLWGFLIAIDGWTVLKWPWIPCGTCRIFDYFNKSHIQSVWFSDSNKKVFDFNKPLKICKNQHRYNNKMQNQVVSVIRHAIQIRHRFEGIKYIFSFCIYIISTSKYDRFAVMDLNDTNS